MTNEEASNILDDFDVNFAGHTAEEIAEAFDVAFKALSQEPCDDAVSREAVLKLKHHKPEYGDMIYAFDVEQLPSVTQKSGKWDRLYSWLNDMRLGIAPDETVDDIDERHCRESQTDILDEIMEWMIKAESEK